MCIHCPKQENEPHAQLQPSAAKRMAAMPEDQQERPHKRRRALSDPNRDAHCVAVPLHFGAPRKLERDSEFWFEDGSIVLISYYGDVGFRVYKRILSEHSAFFRDMFNMPQPPRIPKVDGCPFIYVYEFPSQLKHLLRALFPTKGNLTFGGPPDGLSMDAVCAVVSLAHKYQIEQLVTQGLAHLTEFYTDDFKLWCQPGRSTCLKPEPIEAVRAMNIANLTGTTSILPLAFLHASRAGSAILRGCVGPDGYIEGIALEDIGRIMDGRAQLIQSASTALVRIFDPQVSELCMDLRRCQRVLAHQVSRLNAVLDDLFEEGFAQSWVHLVNLKGEHGHTPWALCKICSQMIERRDREERRAFWESLPDAFGLKIDGWEA